jgi:hypothetical protein
LGIVKQLSSFVHYLIKISKSVKKIWIFCSALSINGFIESLSRIDLIIKDLITSLCCTVPLDKTTVLIEKRKDLQHEKIGQDEHKELGPVGGKKLQSI